MVIYLGLRLPATSSDLPENLDGPSSNVLLFGLAPGGVCLAPAVTSRTGELLPHRFTLTRHLFMGTQYCELLSLLHLKLGATTLSCGKGGGRSVFCGTFLPVTGTGCYPAPCPAEPGLSSRPPGINRKASDHPACSANRRYDHYNYNHLSMRSK